MVSGSAHHLEGVVATATAGFGPGLFGLFAVGGVDEIGGALASRRLPLGGHQRLKGIWHNLVRRLADRRGEVARR